MKILFMGSAELSCICLDALLADERHEVCAVVTQPDRARGRKRQVLPSLVKAHVADRDIPVLTPERVNAEDSLAVLAALQPDIAVVVAYGQILRPALLEMPALGCVNVHASLLPAYRGAAPIQMAIADGCSETGVSIMHMDEGMDTGDVILCRATSIGPDETAGELHARLGELGAGALLEALEQLEREAAREVQDSSAATYASKLTKQDGRLLWSDTAERLSCKIRGFNPWPMCWTESSSGPLRVLKAVPVNGEGEPGVVLALDPDGPVVACGSGALKMLEVQPQGRKVMGGRDFVNGHGLAIGDTFQ